MAMIYDLSEYREERDRKMKEVLTRVNVMLDYMKFIGLVVDESTFEASRVAVSRLSDIKLVEMLMLSNQSDWTRAPGTYLALASVVTTRKYFINR